MLGPHRSGFSLAVASGGYGLAVACRLLISVAFHAAEQAGLSCSMACGIFPDQGSNWCLLIGRQALYHWATREAQRGVYISSLKEGNVRFEKTFQPITCAYFMPGISCPCRISVKIMNVKPSSGLLALPSCVFYFFNFQFLSIYLFFSSTSFLLPVHLPPPSYTRSVM